MDSGLSKPAGKIGVDEVSLKLNSNKFETAAITSSIRAVRMQCWISLRDFKISM
jgi:hypothetical protein